MNRVSISLIRVQNRFSPIAGLLVRLALPFSCSAENPNKPKYPATGLPHRAATPLVQRTLLLLLLFLLSLFNSTRALAQGTYTAPNLEDMSLEDLMLVKIDSVQSASGFTQKLTEAPASVTIITSEDIQRYGYRTLADILRNVRGFYVTYDRNYSDLGVRGDGLPGQYNNSITLLIDGHRLNDNIYDGLLLGTDFQLDVDLIDRVEVIRGPNSSLYVASAFLGVINVITKRGSDLKGVSVAASAASYGSYEARLSYGKKFDNGLELLLSAIG